MTSTLTFLVILFILIIASCFKTAVKDKKLYEKRAREERKNGYIRAEDIYNPGFHFVCDRSLNIDCPRVKNGQPCGDCVGTKNIDFAKVFYDNM